MVVVTQAQAQAEQQAQAQAEQQAEQRTDRLFHALADATRRDILRRTMLGQHSVSGLARSYPMSFAAVQKHVAVLEEAGLVTKRRRGRESLVSGDIQRIRDAASSLDAYEQLWRDRVAQMDQILAEDRDTEE